MASYEQAQHDDPTGIGIVIALAGGMTLVGSLVAAVIAVRIAWRTRKAIRRERRAESARIARQCEYVAGLGKARSLALYLMAGRSLDPLTVWGPVLCRSETAHLDLAIELSRPVTMPTSDYTWTCPMPAQVIVSDRRLLVNADRWQSVWYDDLVGFYPELDQGRLILDISRDGPVQLGGPASAVMAVYVAAMLYGAEAIGRHPTLAPLVK